MPKDVLVFAGTRPEAVKIAPVVRALAGDPGLRCVLVGSGQHPGMVEQALAPFGLAPDESITIDRGTGSQAELVAALLPAFDAVLTRRNPAAVLVHGDTSTTLAGALSAFWRAVPVAHLEAGLRTGDLTAPFPEEGNRQLVARVAALHLAPTKQAAIALEAEHLPHPNIVITGNTVVDAVRQIADARLPVQNPALAGLSASADRLLLVTAHRRESWGAPLDRVLRAVRAVLDDHPGLSALLPLHPNPAVRDQVRAAVGDHPRLRLTEPLAYPDLVHALRRSALVITDSGGIQEEAPTFGVPVLVAREVTERPEAVAAGCAWLVGTDPALIRAEARRLLAADRPVRVEQNPFGDGRAAVRVCEALAALVS